MMRYKYVTLDSEGRRWERIIGEGEFNGYLGLAVVRGFMRQQSYSGFFTKAWIEAVAI